MDALDRDLIDAEVDANRGRNDRLSYIASHGPDVERQWRSGDEPHTSPDSYDQLSSILTVWPLGRNVPCHVTNDAQHAATLRSLHPLEMERIRTQQTQHLNTVGSRPSARARPYSTATIQTVTTLGAGRPVPSNRKEEYLVEFDSYDDPEHPQNFPFPKKYTSPVCL